MSMNVPGLNFLSSRPWFTNEALANMPYNSWLPLYYCNLGGDLQVCVYNDDFAPDNYTFLFNPLAMQYTGTPMLSCNYGVGGCSGVNVNPGQAQEAGERLANQAAAQRTLSNYNQAVATLESALKKVESKLKEEDLSDEEKEKLEDLKTRINDKITEIKDNKKEARASGEISDYYEDSAQAVTDAKELATETNDAVGDVNLSRSKRANTEILDDLLSKLNDMKSKLESVDQTSLSEVQQNSVNNKIADLQRQIEKVEDKKADVEDSDTDLTSEVNALKRQVEQTLKHAKTVLDEVAPGAADGADGAAGESEEESEEEAET